MNEPIIFKTNSWKIVQEQLASREGNLILKSFDICLMRISRFPFVDIGWKLTFVPWVDDKKRFGL